MAHHKSAKKRIRSDAKKKLRNHSYLSSVRTAIRGVREATVDSEQKDGLKPLLEKAQSLLAKAAAKGIIHKNTAARKIARLSKHVVKIQAEPAAATKKVAKKKSTKKKKTTKKKKK